MNTRVKGLRGVDGGWGAERVRYSERNREGGTARKAEKRNGKYGGDSLFSVFQSGFHCFSFPLPAPRIFVLKRTHTRTHIHARLQEKCLTHSRLLVCMTHL